MLIRINLRGIALALRNNRETLVLKSSSIKNIEEIFVFCLAFKRYEFYKHLMCCKNLTVWTPLNKLGVSEHLQSWIRYIQNPSKLNKFLDFWYSINNRRFKDNILVVNWSQNNSLVGTEQHESSQNQKKISEIRSSKSK